QQTNRAADGAPASEVPVDVVGQPRRRAWGLPRRPRFTGRPPLDAAEGYSCFWSRAPKASAKVLCALNSHGPSGLGVGAGAAEKVAVVTLQVLARLAAVLCRLELVRVDAQRDRGIRVTQLARYEHDVAALRNQDARERVAKRVERHARQAGLLRPLSETTLREVAVADRGSGFCREDQLAVAGPAAC